MLGQVVELSEEWEEELLKLFLLFLFFLSEAKLVVLHLVT